MSLLPLRRSASLFLPLLSILLTAAAKNLPPPAVDDPIPTAGTMRIAQHLVLVKLRATVAPARGAAVLGVPSLDGLLARIGATSVAPLWTVGPAVRKRAWNAAEDAVSRIVKIVYRSGDDPRLLARTFAADPSVEYAEPYYIFPLSHVPNDPSVAQQWALTAMKMFDAWDVTTGDSTVTVGSVDTGIDWTHPDLQPSVHINPGEWGAHGELSANGIDDDGDGYIDDWHGWDFIGAGTAQAPRPDNNPMDALVGHGTETSSCFGAKANNGIGIAGTGYRVKILPIKTAADGNSLLILDGYDGILYAINAGCRVISCSWGGTGAYSQALQDIIDLAYSRGALVVTASGNDGIDNDRVPAFPGSFNHVLDVGSFEPSGAYSTWATYGASVHVQAPGSGILTAQRGGGYGSVDGTSFSCPLVAGVAALLFSVHPGWTPDQVLKQIRVTCDPWVSPPDPKRYGRVNASKALSLNATMSDVPGVYLRSMILGTSGLNRFTAPGQTQHLSATFENLLAPTSPNATVSMEFDDPALSTPNPNATLGALGTQQVKSLDFDLTLSSSVPYSEATYPIRFKIVDGSYVDYLVAWVQVYLDDGWHTALGGVNIQLFTSIHARDENVVWAALDYAPNNIPNTDYCLRSANGGQNWFAAGTQGSAGFPTAPGVYCIRAIDAMRALAGTGPQNGSAVIARTADGGATWSQTPVSSMTAFVDIIHMYDDLDGFFIGDPKNGVWGIGTTTDGGATWSPLSQALPAPASEAGWNNAYDVIGDLVWFGTNNSRIYKSTDRGRTWTALATPTVHSTQIAFRDENVGMVRFSKNTTGNDTLALTTNGGQSWSLVSTITAQYGEIAVEKGGKRFWELRGGNAYVTTDLGATWSVQPVPQNVVFISATSSYTNATTTYAYGAGMNIYRFVAPRMPVTDAASPAQVPSVVSIADAYPNPAVPDGGVIVRFALPAAAMTSVDLFDAAGRLVRHVVDAVLRAGMQELRIDTRGLRAGAYFVRVSGGGNAATRGVVVR